MPIIRLAGVMALLVLACCDAPPQKSSGSVIDTLPSGLRVVTNLPPWLDGSTRGLIQATEELRIGTAVSSGPEEFGVVSGLEVDGEGRIYVSDMFSHDIRVFHPDGAFSHAFGRMGEGPGELDAPWGILLDQRGRVWVRDVRNMRFSLFGRDGSFLDVRPIRHNTVAGPWRAGFDRSGHLVEWDFLRPFIIHPDGSASWDERARSRFERTFWPLRFQENGLLLDTLPPLRNDLPPNYYADRGRPYWIPALDFAIDTQGSVWFAVSDRYQVWRRTLEGDTLLTFSLPAEPLMDPSVGEPFPMVDRILADKSGHVYVLPRTKDVTPLGTAVDAFDSTGVFLGTGPPAGDGPAGSAPCPGRSPLRRHTGQPGRALRGEAKAPPARRRLKAEPPRDCRRLHPQRERRQCASRISHEIPIDTTERSSSVVRDSVLDNELSEKQLPKEEVE